MVMDCASRRKLRKALEERVKELERSGVLIRSASPKRALKPIEKRPGALARFLAERG